MNLYAYGLIETADVLIPGDLFGLGGEAIHVAPVGAFFAVVSEFPHLSLNADKQNILAHERVLDAVLNQTTPLPFRFGVVVNTQQLSEFVLREAQTLECDFQTVRGCVQMSVKLIAKSATAENDRSAAEEGPGSRFLKQKLAGRDALIAAAGSLNDRMGALLRGVESTVQTTPRLMISLAHLVERRNVDEYSARLAKTSAERTDLAWMQSGPWPPYGFASAGLALRRAVRA